jgi:hypothetical protein
VTTDEKFRHAIDAISEALRVNGAESSITDFCVNYLAANLDDLVQLWEEDYESR